MSKKNAPKIKNVIARNCFIMLGYAIKERLLSVTTVISVNHNNIIFLNHKYCTSEY